MQPTFTAFNEKAETHTVLFRSKYRFNDKFSLAYSTEYTKINNDRGWVGLVAGNNICR
jgi:hypothetical protein